MGAIASLEVRLCKRGAADGRFGVVAQSSKQDAQKRVDEAQKQLRQVCQTEAVDESAGSHLDVEALRHKTEPTASQSAQRSEVYYGSVRATQWAATIKAHR